MKVIQSPTPWDCSSNFVTSTNPHLVFDVTAAQCLSQTWDSRIWDVPGKAASVWGLSQNTDLFAVPDILIVRPGSFGDLLLLTPLIRHLQKHFPDRPVKVSCLPQYAPILQGVVETVTYPLELPKDCVGSSTRPAQLQDKIQELYPGLLWMEGVLENRESSSRYTNRYAQVAGIPRLDDEGLDYLVTPAEEFHQKRVYPRTNRLRIGVQYRASTLTKSYPDGQVAAVCGLLLDAGVEVVLLARHQEIQIPGDRENFFNLAEHQLTIREVSAVAASCDALIVPDSYFAHLGNALGIPTVVLAGPYDPAITMAPSRHLHFMVGEGKCRNCQWHHPTIPFHPTQACGLHEPQFCHVLATLKPSQVVAKALGLAQLNRSVSQA